MQHSSKHNPCPICGRDIDDKCRWNDSTILCYCGNSFHPPEHLALGQIILASGVNWKLISYYSGFAKSSYLFSKTDELSLLSPLEKRKKLIQVRQGAKEKTIEYKQKFVLVRKLLHKSLKICDLQLLTIDEIFDGRKLVKTALDDCSKLLSIIVEHKARMALKRNQVLALKYWEKQLVYQLEDIDRFCFLYLMHPVEKPVPIEEEEFYF